MTFKMSIVLLFGIILNTVAEQTNSESEDSESGLVIELEEPEANKEYKVNTSNDKDHAIIVNNSNLRREFSYDEQAKFTDFIRHLIGILKGYNDKDLAEFFVIIDNEIRKHHCKDCDFYESVNTHELSRLKGKELETIKSKVAADIRNRLDAITNKLEYQNYNEKEKEFIDFINSLYRKHSIHHFNKILINVDDYRLKSRRNLDLVEILRDGMKSIIFDNVGEMYFNGTKTLTSKIEEFWNYVLSVSATFVMQHYLNKQKLSEHIQVFGSNQLSDDTDDTFEINTTEKQQGSKQAQRDTYSDSSDDSDVEHHTTKKYRYKTVNTFGSKENVRSLTQVFNDKRRITEMDVENDKNLKRNSFKKVLRGNAKKDFKLKDKNQDKSQNSTNIFDKPTTMRQMYIEHLNVKHPKYHKIQHDSTTKSLDWSTTLRQLYIEHMKVKTEQGKFPSHKHKHSSIFRSNDKVRKTGKKKQFVKTRDESTTLRQMYLERVDTKNDSPTDTDDIEFRSNVKSPDKSKSSTEVTTLRQVYLESMEYHQDINTNSRNVKRKINTLVDLMPSYNVLYSHNIPLLDNDAAYKPSTPREIQVGIMGLKYEPRAQLTEIKNDGNKPNHISSSQENINITHSHEANNHTNSIYIDIDPKYLTQKHIKHATTRNTRTFRHMHLKKPNNREIKVSNNKVEVLEVGNTKKHKKGQKEVQYLKNSKKNMSGTPKYKEIRRGIRGKPENKKTKHIPRDKIIRFSPVFNTIPRRPTPEEFNKKTDLSTELKQTGAYTSNHRKYFTMEPILSEDGLSINECKHSYRKMESPVENLLNGTAVLTRIQQLENELRAVKTKVENDTEIIKKLDNKIYETERRLKEFSNQEFKVVKVNKTVSGNDQSIDSIDDYHTDENETSHEDMRNECINDAPKSVYVARSRLNTDTNLNNQFDSNSTLNKDDDSVITKPSYKDIEMLYEKFNNRSVNATNIVVKTVKSDDDYIDEPFAKDAEIVTESITKSNSTDATSIHSSVSSNNYNIKLKKESEYSNVGFPKFIKDENKFTSNDTKIALQEVHQKYKSSEEEFEEVTAGGPFKGVYRLNSNVQNIDFHKRNKTTSRNLTATKQTYSDSDKNKETTFSLHVIDKNDYSNENDKYEIRTQNTSQIRNNFKPLQSKISVGTSKNKTIVKGLRKEKVRNKIYGWADTQMYRNNTPVVYYK